MKTLLRSEDRGSADFGWLKAKYSFSFGDYYDERRMGFRSLRVMNEDRVAPGQGFGMHPHRDMEIVTIVLSGALEHRDSLGHGAVLRPGEVQRMSAGTGIRHSEFNPSTDEPTHLYQIWLLPERRGLPPGYEQRPFDLTQRIGRWQCIASPHAEDGDALRIQQDARLSLATLTAGTVLPATIAHGRHAWVQVLCGAARLDDVPLSAGDGIAISDETQFNLISGAEEGGAAEVLWFDLA